MLGMNPVSSVPEEFICLVTAAQIILPLCGDECLSQIKIDPTDE